MSTLYRARAALTGSHGFAVILVIALLVANVAYLPRFASPSQWPLAFGQLAPLALIAMATMPSVVSGGLDISIGPLANFVGILFSYVLLPSGMSTPWVSIPICLAIGAAIGAINGFVVSVLRYQAIIATLASFIILGGINVMIAPTAQTHPANWTSHLARTVLGIPGGLLMLVVVGVVWFALSRTAFHRSLYAVGGDAPASYSAGVPLVRVRIAAYMLGGAVAALAGLTLVGMVGSIDYSYGQQYALVGIAAVALGGAALRGGRGGMVGAVIGAFAIYLVQNVMLAAHVNILWVQVIYGVFLIVGVVAGPLLASMRPRRVSA